MINQNPHRNSNLDNNRNNQNINKKTSNFSLPMNSSSSKYYK